MKQVLLASAAVLGIAYATPVVVQDTVEDEAAAKDDIVRHRNPQRDAVV